MDKYLLDSKQLERLLEKTIDLFQEYQYKRGMEEPQARSKAVMEVIGYLRRLTGQSDADP